MPTTRPNPCKAEGFCCGKNAHCENQNGNAVCVCNGQMVGNPSLCNPINGGCYKKKDDIDVNLKVGFPVNSDQTFEKGPMARALNDAYMTYPAYKPNSVQVTDMK